MAGNKKTKAEEVRYTKRALVNADTYGEYRDLLAVLLEEDKQYTNEEADKIIAKFLRKEVE